MAQSFRWTVVVFVFVSGVFLGHHLLSPQVAGAQTPANSGTAATTAATDDLKLPFLVERVADKVVFQKDGTSTQETTLRVRIQSTSAVQQFGVLRLPYASAVGDAEVVYARVLKPNGTVVVTPAENILDMPAEITRSAPFYSDLKEKQVAIKGLEAGDILEYQTRLNVRKPLIPGQFWFASDFQ